MSSIYTMIVLLYAWSVLFYFIDFMHYNQKAKRLAFWLLAIVWGMQCMYFIHKLLQHGTFPLLSQADTLFFYSWLLISLSLVCIRFFRMDAVLFFIQVLGFGVMAVSVYIAGTEQPAFAETFMSQWVIMHVTMAFLSYAAFTISFVLGMLYVGQHYMLKKKKWVQQLRRMPGLGQLDRYVFYMNMIGLPLLVLSLVLGTVWAHYTLEHPFWMDTKVIFSLVVSLMYGVYLYQRIVRGWTGVRIAELNILCFGVLLFNYIISRIAPTFHG